MSERSEEVKITRGSGNVFADLGFSDAQDRKVKAGLAIQITRAIQERGLSQAAAGKIMGIAQPKVSAILRGRLDNFSEQKLRECVNALGYDVTMNISKSSSDAAETELNLA